MPDLTKLPRGGIGAALYNVEHSLRLDPELQLLHHQADEGRSACRPDQRHAAAPVSCSWRARARPSTTSRRSRSTTRARCIGRRRRKANAPRGARIMFAGSDGVEKTLYYFSTDLSNSGVKIERLPEILRDARARQQPDQERVLSAALRQLHHGARFPARQQRHHHPGRFRHSARLLQSRRNGASSRSAAMPVRSANSPGRYQESYAELFRRAQPMDFGIGYRWRTHESNLLLSVSAGRRHRGAGGDVIDRAAAAAAAPAQSRGRRQPSSRSRGRRLLLVRALRVAREALPAHALARLDEGVVRRSAADCGRNSAGGDDDDEQRERRPADRSAGGRDRDG